MKSDKGDIGDKAVLNQLKEEFSEDLKLRFGTRNVTTAIAMTTIDV